MKATTIPKSLHKVPGREFVSSFALDTPWELGRADPNGYYRLLGLQSDCFMGDIRRAYKLAMYAAHPDTGIGATESLMRINIAYQVLGNPRTRREYDFLTKKQRWIDLFVIEEARHALGTMLNNLGIGRDAIEARLRKLLTDEPLENGDVEAWYGGLPLLFAFYYECDTNRLPPTSDIEEWLNLIGAALWHRGVVDIVRICFHDGRPAIRSTSWGKLFLIPTGVKPLGTLAEFLAWNACNGSR